MITVEVIKNEEQYIRAMKRVQDIFLAEPNTPEAEELEVLVTLIGKYEREYYPIELPDPIDAIKERMRDLSLKDKDLVPIIGNKTSVSQILNRKRALTIEMIRALSSKLGLSVELLIQPYELDGKQTLKSV
ncbi:helix-turn-helix domain-containing protein [Lunatimonas salinarum]|uniref:helix-turn-helix domain-containing protein n=1 Tax=Lunatimonas salinarum TaxID=1774590 RepID=UPI001ADEC61E|nr:transcriptional regulator [Lunatimonas salinarum]